MSTERRKRRALILTGLILFEILVAAAAVFVVVAGTTSPGRASWSFWSGLFLRMQASERIERMEVPLDRAPANIVVNNPLGRIDVVGSEEATAIRIEGEKLGYGWSRAQAERVLRETRVEVRESGGRRFIEVIHPGNRFTPSNLFSGYATVDLVVTVPARSDVGVQANLGDVAVSGVAGTVAVDADMGSVRVDRVRGEVRVDAAMGSIEVNDVEGNLRADAAMGSIAVRHAKLTEWLSLKAAMGSIRFSGVPARRSDVTSNMGGIELVVPRSPAFNLESRSSLGAITIDAPFQGLRGEREAMGTLGSGEPAGHLAVRAEMGSIEIREGAW